MLYYTVYMVTPNIIYLVLRYANKGTQELMELMMEIYLRENLLSFDFFKGLLIHPDQGDKLKLTDPVEIGRTTARSIMYHYAPRSANLGTNQLDASSLRYILRNCKVYQGWAYNNDNVGYIQAYHSIIKMRNDDLAHNNSHKIRQG